MPKLPAGQRPSVGRPIVGRMQSKDFTTGAHWQVLQCVARDPCHADEIQQRCGSFGTMIDVLADLVEAGQVVMGADHRYILTAKGWQFMEEHGQRKRRQA